MLDHVSLNVSNLEKSRDFYAASLKPLGYSVVMDIPQVAKWGVQGCSLGENGQTRLWLTGGETVVKLHIAFRAQSMEEVQAFHVAAIAAGGVDNGAPGPREQYGPNYYAAFVYDADGNNVEAVYRG